MKVELASGSVALILPTNIPVLVFSKKVVLERARVDGGSFLFFNAIS